MDPETTPATAPDPTPTDAAAEALAALDTGIEAAADPSPAPAPATEPVVDNTNAGGEQQAAAPIPGTEPTPEQKAAADAAAAEAAAPQPDKATEDEITALGLKEKSAERFRELAGQVRELAPVKELLTKAGITDLAQLPQVIERSRQADDLIGMVMETGADAQQFGASLDYLALTHRAAQGDLAAAERAFALVAGEYAALAKALGKEVPGVHDPLAAHADLLEEIENGMSRERALELASARDKGKLVEQARGQQHQQQQATAAQTKAVQDGMASLQEFDRSMLASDPSYLARRGALSAEVALIRAQHPPHEWAARAAIALAKIPAPAPAAAAPAAKPAPGAMRPGGTSTGVLTPETDDPMAALDMGIELASR